MNEKLLDQLFSCIEEASAEQLWLDMLEKYQIENDDVAIVTFSEQQWTLLHYAAENLFVRVAEWLISQGAVVDALDTMNNTPFLIGLDAAIDCAVQNNDNEIDFSIVSFLLRNGADENAKSNNGTDKNSLLRSYGKNATNQYYSKVNN